MLSRSIRRAAFNSKNLCNPQGNKLVNTMFRTAYTKETQPHVFINQHTKVLVQGMTGKHVSKLFGTIHNFRKSQYIELFILIVFFFPIGYVPYSTINCLWYQGCRWNQQEESRYVTLGSSSLW